MKKFDITITAKNGDEILSERKAINIRRMWKAISETFDEHLDSTVYVTKDGEDFMRLHRVQVGNGKFWLKNDIKESRRKPKAKAVETPDETPAETLPESAPTELPVEDVAENPVIEKPTEEEDKTEEINLDDFKVPTIEEVENIAAN